jgi:hypothetical protein
MSHVLRSVLFLFEVETRPHLMMELLELTNKTAKTRDMISFV